MSDPGQLQQAITALETQRGTLGDAVVDAAIRALRQQFDPIHSQASGSAVFEVPPQQSVLNPDNSQAILSSVELRERPRTFTLIDRGVAGIVPRMIGREAEFSALQTFYQAAVTGGTVHWTTVWGEPGTGKSRLLAELAYWLASRPEAPRVFRGRADPQTERVPYALVRDWITSWFLIAAGEPLSAAREKLTVGLQGILGEPAGSEAAAFIGQLIGLDFHESPWIAHIVQDTRQIRDRAEVLLRECLAALSAARPIVLLLEDLDWVDRESLALLEGLLKEPRGWQWAVFGAAGLNFRNRRPGWGQDPAGNPLPHYHELQLAPLPSGASAQLVRELLQKLPEPPDWLVELLVERSGGNPYFIEELLLWLIEHYVIVPGGDPWRVESSRMTGLNVPGTISGLLQARLERLHADERAMLQRAAVLGGVFWERGVAYIGEMAGSPERWEALARRGMVESVPFSQWAGETEYHFKHALLRDGVYESTLKKYCRIYHRRAALWLERVSGERVSEWAAAIAHHYEQAEELSTASEWYGRAADHAATTDAGETAIRYYRKALVLSPGGDPVQQLRLSKQLGEMLRRQARYIEALEALQAALSAAEALNDPAAQAEVWVRITWAQNGQGDYPAARMSVEWAERLARASGAQEQLALALFRKGQIFYRVGEVETARVIEEQALALSRKIGDRTLTARSLNMLGMIHSLLGHAQQAADCYEQALDLLRETGDRGGQGALLNNLGSAAESRGNYADAIQLYQEGLVVAREVGERESELLLLCNLGSARIGLGEFTAAEELLRRALAMAEPVGWYAVPAAYRMLAEACLGQDKLGPALALALRAVSLGVERRQRMFLGTAWRVLGQVAARLGEPVPLGETAYDAAACFAESRRILRELRSEGDLARTLRAWSIYAGERGDRVRAEQLWREARAIFTRLLARWEVARMDAVHPEWGEGLPTDGNRDG